MRFGLANPAWHDSAMSRPPRRRRFTRIPLGRPWCEALELENGRRLIVRPVEANDAETLRRSFSRLTADEIRFRFLHPINELTRDHSRELTRIDRRNAFALVVIEALPPNEALIGAVARASIDQGGNQRRDQAEFALIVGHEIGGYGLGEYLLGRLIEWSRKKRLSVLYGNVMIDNDRMLRLARRMGFHIDPARSDGQVFRIERSLRQD